MLFQTIKENGSTQRADITLNLNIANAIRNHVLSGGKTYDKQGFIEITIREDNQNIRLKIRTGTLNSWITRGNVIPETGVELKQFIDEAKEDYRIKMKEQLKDKLVQLAERKAYRALNLRSNRVVRDPQGNKMIDKDTGLYVRQEDVKLLAVQMNIAKYILDRLDKINFGRQSEKDTIVSFDLGGLREAKERLDNENSQ